MEDGAASRLTAAGFDRYEISNYSRPGYRCRHNLHYWTGGDYLGLGPSAQSYLAGRRFGNVEDLMAYSHALEEGRLPTGPVETLTPEQRHREALVFGLRLIEGIDLPDVAGPEPDGDWTDAVTRLTGQGLLETRRRRLRLTELGRRYADSVAVELL
jgi:oxygen-independent coproporphyrinogen-3 oxidase